MDHTNNSIKEKQEQIIREFSEIGDSFDRYSYLIELACLHEPMPEEKKTESNLVRGCQSHVWLDIDCTEGFLRFSSDSDTLIIKGVLYLLEEIFNGSTFREAADAEVTFLKEIGIMENFESERQKGIGYVIRTLQDTAKKMS